MARSAVRPTLADRVVNWFDPVAGERRLRARAFQAAMGGYAGASETARTMRTWFTRGQSADADVVSDLPKLRERSRDLVRNHPLAGGALHTIVTRTVGTGLALQPRPNRKVLGWTEERVAQWREHLLAEWCLWAESRWCDLGGRLDFYGLQELVFRSTLESGDTFTLLPMVRRGGLPYRLALQVLEADRVGNPGGQTDTDTMVAGVQLDAMTGAALRFHVYNRHPGGLSIDRIYEGRWVPAATPRGAPAILHHYRMMRPGQTRGVPHLAPVIEPLKQLGRYTDAEIMAAVVSGMFTVFVKSDGPETNPLMVGTDASGAPQSGSDSVKLENGAIIGLSPGEDISIADPKRPNTAFDPFVMAVMRQIAVGLELPFEVLVKHFTSSYSAARAALLDAYQFFRARRDWLRKSFCQPVFEAWMEEAVALGRIEAPGFLQDPAMRAAYCRAVWTGDSPGSLDPVKEISAWTSAIDAHLATREQAEMELFGTDFAASLDQKAAEARMLREAGLSVAPAAPGGAPALDAPQPDDESEDDAEDDEEPDDDERVAQPAPRAPQD
ncbi:MAG: phage portal protein [Burkholderiaceae bacterium]|nr:phage portal protein [Burkholderiales bacterium]MCZ8339646.1 phage portal protein [Burkholderiaceae bacterium]